MQKRLLSSPFVAAAALVPAVAAHAAPAAKPAERITCHEFVTLDDQFKPQTISYLIGYNKAKHPDQETIDISGVERIVSIVTESCKAKPEETLSQRIRALWNKL